MKMKYLLVLLIFSYSCNPIMKTIYGIKDPQVETKESLNKYMNSISMGSENNLVVNKKGKYNIVLDDFKKIIPESVLFDSTGKRLTYKKEEQDCNAGLFATIPELTINSSLKEEKGSNLEEFKSNLIYLDNEKSVGNLPKADFYLFISWARFVGKLNKDHVKVWEKLAKDNPNAKIIVFKVNMDMQKRWE